LIGLCNVTSVYSRSALLHDKLEAFDCAKCDQCPCPRGVDEKRHVPERDTVPRRLGDPIGSGTAPVSGVRVPSRGHRVLQKARSNSKPVTIATFRVVGSSDRLHVRHAGPSICQD